MQFSNCEVILSFCYNININNNRDRYYVNREQATKTSSYIYNDSEIFVHMTIYVH